MTAKQKYGFLAIFILSILYAASLLHSPPRMTIKQGTDSETGIEKTSNGIDASENSRQRASIASSAMENLAYRHTPRALLVQGATFLTGDPTGEFLTLETESSHDAHSAMRALNILSICNQIPAVEHVTAEMNEELQLEKSRAICSEIEQYASVERHELIRRAAALGHPEAILRLPSFPPPFLNTTNRSASESFLEWQESTISQLEQLADDGNVDARIRLARLYAGAFPAFTDTDLAYLYVEEILRSPSLTSVQEAAAASLRDRLPKPSDL